MNDCAKCNRTDVKCCHTCKKDANKCSVWHHCGSDCSEHEEKVKTNADRIRSMTDEELAAFLCKVKADYQWVDQNFPREDESEEWEIWLQSEVEGE